MTMFLTVWLSAQWPNSWPSTASTSSLLHPILRFLFASPSSFALFDSSSFVSSLVEANLCVSLSLLSSVSSATVDSTGSWNYVTTRTALISGYFLSASWRLKNPASHEPAERGWKDLLGNKHHGKSKSAYEQNSSLLRWQENLLRAAQYLQVNKALQRL